MSTAAERNQIIDRYEEEFKNASGIYLTDFRGITVEKMTKLRTEFRTNEVKYIVVKNSLAKIALERCNGEKKDLIPFVKGHTGIAVAPEEATAPSKVIRDFQKENADLLPVTQAIVEGTLYGPDAIGKLADLPSREVLLSQLLSVLQAPTTNFAGALNGVFTKLLGVLESLRSKKESEG